MSVAAATARQPGATAYWKPWDLWVLALPLLAMSPLLLVEFQKLMNRPERQFFPLLVLIALYFPVKNLLDNKDKQDSPIPVVRLRFALGLFLLGAILYVLSAIMFSPWGAHVAALLVFFAWALGRCITVPWTSVAAWTGLLLVTVPLPFQMDENFVGWLQTSSSAACGYALDALSVPHVRLANVIEIKGHQLFVEEACSGIGSMYALLAAGALLLVINGRSFVTSLIVILSVPVWAMFGNFLRLLAIALAQQWYDRDLSHGLDHDLLGVLTFSIAALGMWMTEWLVVGFLQPLPPSSAEMSFVFRTINAVLCWPNSDPLAGIVDTEDETPQERAAREARELAQSQAAAAAIVRVQPWQSKTIRVLAKCAVAVIIVVSILPAIVVSRDASPNMLSFGIAEFSQEQMAKMPKAESMPATIGQWRRVDFASETRSTASALGAHSLIWEYRKGDQRYLLSVDFAFRGFHWLEVCYGNSGWRVESVKPAKDKSEEAWDWREIEMNNEFSSRGFVCYSFMDEDGNPFAHTEEAAVASNIGERLFKSLNRGRSKNVFQPVLYQIQLICEQGLKLSNEELEELRDQYVQGRRALRVELSKALQ